MNPKLIAIAIFCAALVAGLSACGSLKTFNAVVPFDDAKRIAHNLPFGADPRQSLDIYTPNTTPSGQPLPVIIFIYGGSWATGDKGDYAFVGAALASRGFITVLPDYRLVPTARFPDFVNDGAQALRWTQDNIGRFGGDPKQIVLMGHSAGAYNAMMIALDTRFLIAAGVKDNSVKGVVGIAGPYDFYPFDVKATQDAFGLFAEPAQTQAISFARKDAPPILLLTAADDTTVKPRNAQSLAFKLKEEGAIVENKIYPDLGHVGILLSLSRALRYKASTLDDAVEFARKVTAP